MRPSSAAVALLLFACGSHFTEAASPGDDGGTGGADDGSTAADDGGGAGDSGAAGTWCAAHAPNAKLCADFDNVPTPDTGWSAFLATGSPSLANMPNAPSPPNAFLASVMDAKQQVDLVKTFATAPTQSARLDFDLNVQKATINDGFSSLFVAGIDLPTREAGAVGLFLSQSGELGTVVAESADAGKLPSFQGTGVKPPTGQWAGRIRIELTFGSNAHVQVYLNGNAIGNATSLPGSLQRPPGLMFEVGLLPSNSVGPSAVAFDNVVVDFR